MTESEVQASFVKTDEGWFVEYLTDGTRWLLHDVKHLNEAVEAAIALRQKYNDYEFYTQIRLRNGKTGEIIPEEAFQ